MRKALLLLWTAAGALVAQENVEWEVATVRIASTYSKDQTPLATVLVCRGVKVTCKSQEIEANLPSPADWNDHRDAIMAMSLASLGREGFEVVGVIRLGADNTLPTVLLKRKRRAE